VFLGFEDHWHDNEQKQFTRWNHQDAEQACWKLAYEYDLILTHNQDGDYGHIHHKLVYNAVAQHHNVVQFSQYGEQTVTYRVPPDTYSLAEVPLHGEIVGSFHPTGHQNSYKESQ
jgi:hypothetical protein